MRPHYYQEYGESEPQFRFGDGQFMWTPVLRFLLIFTVACYLLQVILEGRGYRSAVNICALDPRLVTRGYLWQLLTYGFLHSVNPWHIFTNMLILWIFGKDVERTLGAGRFLALYLLSIIAAGICSSLLDPDALVKGASGGVLGVLMAFGMLFPRRTVFFMLLFPMPAKMVVLFVVLLDLWASSSATQSRVAVFAHLGGLGFGYLFIKTRSRWERYLADMTFSAPEKEDEQDDRVSVEDEVEMDRLLSKIKSEGIHALTWREKRFLDRISERLRNR